MSKKLLIIIIILLLAAAGITYAALNKEDEPILDSPNNNTEVSPPEANQNPSGSGRYVSYSDTVIAETEGNKVLFFHAPWCPQCRAIEADIERDGVPEGLTVIKVDYDSNQALRQKYGVTIQTSFVKVDDEGNFVDRYVAYDEPTFESVKANFLN